MTDLSYHVSDVCISWCPQLELFRSLKRTEKVPIGHNYRTLQARYGREVVLRRPEDEEDDYYHRHSEIDRLSELHEQLLEQEMALLSKQRAAGAGLRPGVLTALIAAVGAAIRLM